MRAERGEFRNQRQPGFLRWTISWILALSHQRSEIVVERVKHSIPSIGDFHVRRGCAFIASVHQLAEQFAVGLCDEAERLAVIFQARGDIAQSLGKR